ncbi:putative Carbonic anhydrase [Glarea lozoyensis 74030]|uniref:Putative Carbonic anhydrase n=1 Tax=Glarea lozoyensis (strain ATCC 74030 / MF5533) TaxID=1104152 RepID=H0EPL6_GLAL7|nr:putative Carbonic anhydrase [Glarea lozoyensis 74030]
MGWWQPFGSLGISYRQDVEGLKAQCEIARHSYPIREAWQGRCEKRQHGAGWEASALGRRATAEKDWTYDASHKWGDTNPRNLFNWNYGAAFDRVSNDTISSSNSFTFDDETVYLKGWHIHAPADHSVDGIKSRAELHLVHADATGTERAVLAIRMDPGTSDSPFVAQFVSAINDTSPDVTKVPNFDSTNRVPVQTMDVSLALKEVGNFKNYWTYNGGLTSPPCREGIRFFVAGKVMMVGMKQMQEILQISAFSTRAEQMIWMHEVNV